MKAETFLLDFFCALTLASGPAFKSCEGGLAENGSRDGADDPQKASFQVLIRAGPAGEVGISCSGGSGTHGSRVHPG